MTTAGGDTRAGSGSRRDESPYDPLRTPYMVDENDFPLTGLLEEQVRFLLRYAVLAPSTHNSQPWRFFPFSEGVEIYADYARRLPRVDPGNRELLMSIGAAIFTLRVAAERFGLDCRVTYNYSGDSERPLAVASFAPKGESVSRDGGLASLFRWIPRRHANRNPFLASRIPETLLRRIRGMAVGNQASLHLSTDGKVNQDVGDLVAASEKVLLADPAFRGDVAEWIRPNWTQKPDGIPGAALGLHGIAAAMGAWTARTLDTGKRRAAADRSLCSDAPGLVVLQCEDTVPHWLECGELLQKLLLTLTAEDLHHSYFNMPVQVPDARLRLRALLGLSSWPQILLRIGFSLAVPVITPRRPLDEVVIERIVRR